MFLLRNKTKLLLNYCQYPLLSGTLNFPQMRNPVFFPLKRFIFLPSLVKISSIVLNLWSEYMSILQNYKKTYKGAVSACVLHTSYDKLLYLYNALRKYWF